MKRTTAKRNADEQLLDVALNIRVTSADAERLDALCDRISIATGHGIARAALRLGVRALEADPTLIITAGTGGAEPSRRARKKNACSGEEVAGAEVGRAPRLLRDRRRHIAELRPRP